MNRASSIPSPVRIIRFGEFEVDLQSGELRKHGLRIKLQEQPFRVLTLLLERAGEVVTREELRQKLWSTDTFVDFEHSLNTSIKKLRQALGDSPDNPRFVETLARRGYRFIAPIERIRPSFPLDDAPLPVSTASDPSPVDVPKAPPKLARSPRQARRLMWLAAVLLLAIAGAASWRWFHRSGSSNLAPMTASRLTSFRSLERDGALSPDGKQLAFAWDGERGNFDIYVQLVDTGKPVRLTESPANDFCPVWSPDGLYIAFGRSSAQDSGFYVIPFIGGQERKLADAAFSWPRPYRALDWSPDGKLLAVADRTSSQEPFSIFLVSVETGDRRKLTSPPLTTSASLEEGDSSPVFSPDGRSLAFARGAGSTFRDIFVMPVDGGEPKRLISDRLTYGLDWTSDSREIVFSSAVGAGARRRLWRTSVSRASPELLTIGGEFALNPTVSTQGSRLIYTEWINSSAIWQIDLAGSKGIGSHPVISSTQVDNSPQYSPDGEKVVFASTRTGSYEIWTCDRDGGNLQRLTFFGGPLTGTPRWSPDGRQIAFDSRPNGYSDIFLISSNGGTPRCLTPGTATADDILPSWSRDGHWIYFTSDRSGRPQVWKMSSEGGPAVRVIENGGFEAFESADSKTIYFSRQNPVGIWKIPVDGGKETPIFQEKMLLRSWVVAKEGIYFAAEGSSDGTRIGYLNFSTRAVSQIAAIERQPVRFYPALAVSPDGQRLLCALKEPDRSDIMLIENFR